jgi:hypothetical protein
LGDFGPLNAVNDKKPLRSSKQAKRSHHQLRYSSGAGSQVVVDIKSERVLGPYSRNCILRIALDSGTWTNQGAQDKISCKKSKLLDSIFDQNPWITDLEEISTMGEMKPRIVSGIPELKARMTVFERIEQAIPLLTKEKEAARNRLVSAGKNYGRGRGKTSSVPSMAHTYHGIRAVDIVASQIGISARTFYRGLELIEKASEQMKLRLKSGELTIGRAYEMLKEIEIQEQRREMIIAPLALSINVNVNETS